MATKDNDTDNVVDLLKQGHFGKQDAGIPASVDSVMETMLVLTLDQLKEYDRNPRRAQNAEYDALKASLIQTGTSKVLLVVTKRPGEGLYFPAAGGNTRLRILKELWEEFGDEKYRKVNCKFVPYQDETRVLVDHLSENDNRSDYIFIDRAKGVCEIYAQLAAELEGTLSERAFIGRLLELGYPKLSQRQFGRFKYAVSLYEYIPMALDGGMNDFTVRNLRSTLEDLKSFLSAACSGDPDVIAAYDEQWKWELDRLDSAEGIDLDTLPGMIFESLAPMAMQRAPDLEPDEVTARLKYLWKEWCVDRSLSVSLRDGSVSKREKYDPTRSAGTRVYSPDELDEYSRRQGYASDDGGRPDGSDDSGGSDTAGPGFGRKSVFSGGDATGHAKGTDRSPRSGGQDPGSFSGAEYRETAPGSDSYPRLWARNLELAKTVASRFEFGDYIQTFGVGDEVGVGGTGYWIDLPDRRLEGYAVTVWWLLWDIAGVTEHVDFIPEMIRRKVTAGTLLEKNWVAVGEGQASLSRREIESFPPDRRNAELLQAFMHLVESGIPRVIDQARFFRLTGDSEYEALVEILGNVRTLEQIAREYEYG